MPLLYWGIQCSTICAIIPGSSEDVRFPVNIKKQHLSFLFHRIIEWVGRGLKDHLVPNTLSWAGAFPLDPGFPCLKQYTHGVSFTPVFALEGFKEQAKQLLAAGERIARQFVVLSPFPGMEC